MPTRRIEVEIIGDSRSVEAAFGRALTGSTRLQRGLEPLARGAKRTLVGLGVLGVAAAKLSIDFQRTSAQMVGLGGVGAQQVEEWKKAMLDLAPVVGKTPNELAQALYQISSSGAKASDALSILEASAKASSAGLGDTAVVADAVTSAMNAYRESGLTAASATDTLVAAVREGKGEADAIAPSLGNVIPTAAQLGVTFKEVAAAIASMTTIGFDADTAATNLSATLSAILKPGRGAEEAFHKIGTSTKELRAQLEKQGLIATLRDLRTEFDGNSAAMARAFPNIRALRGVLSLVGKASENTDKVFRNMSDTTGSLGHAFSAVAETDGFKLDQAFAEIQADGVKMGGALAPVLADMASGLGSAASFASEHETATKDAALAVAGFSVAIIAANTALKIYNSNLVAATIGQEGLAKVGRVAGPIALLAVGVGTLAYAISRLPDPTQQAADAIRDLNAQLDIFATRSGEVNTSATELAHARLAEKAAVLALKSAEQNLAKVQGDSHATSLERKQAALGVKEAEQGVADAIHRRTSAEILNRGAQKAAADADRAAGKALEDIADKYRVLGRAVERGGRQSKASADAAAESLGHFRTEMRNVASGATQASPRVRDMAGDILELTKRIGRIPSKTEIELALTNYVPTKRSLEDIRAAAVRASGTYGIDFIIRTHGSINAPTGVARGSQHGGPVAAGIPRIVGERNAEVFIPETRGYIAPTVQGAAGKLGAPGPMAFVITNWREGRGYLLDVAEAAVRGRSRLDRQVARMGGGL